MKFTKKLKNRKGMTLVEVLLVVGLMVVMLGLAMPNLLSGSAKIKFAEMNDNARAVAVAVQSKLYGMKNAGTSPEYKMLTDNAKTVKLITAEGEKEVNLLCNFGENADISKKHLLAGQ